jgi:hypothetical protein
MAIRTTRNDVLGLLDSDVSINTAVLDRIIIAASALVDQVFVNVEDPGDTLLTEIEMWLSAHMVASTPMFRTTADEKIGDAQVRYTGQWGKMLESTPYGQMVLTLDITGQMAKAGKAAASIYAVTSFED